MDFSEKESESSTVDNTCSKAVSSSGNRFNGIQRSCADCNTTKTPLWRGGPAGPKSLCNACGIRYRKKRRALLGLKSGDVEKKKERRKAKGGVSYKLRLLALGRDVLLERSLLQKHRKLAEEEEAAVLLMALSYGLVHA